MQSTSTMRTAIITVIHVLLSCIATAQIVENIDSGWQFALDTWSSPEEFDTARARTVDLPHDWAFENGYSPEGAQQDRGGYLSGGVGWYQKEITLPAKWAGKNVRIEFDAVYMDSDVWVNGHHLGNRPYGYISFSYDLTPYLKPGKNQITVKVDDSLEPSARWYHGCGIYGHVNLIATHAVSVAYNGTYVTTPQVSQDRAAVNIETTLVNTEKFDQQVILEMVILDPAGNEAARAQSTVTVKGNNQTVTHDQLEINSPSLWNVQTPQLYTAISRIKVNGKEVDEYNTPFGIRLIKWDTKTGFWLNGKNIKLKGVCEHLEGGPIGAAWSDEMIEWKIKLLKEMGCNSIRTAHNPQVPAFYRTCDRLGMLVMDEIFDGWKKKAPEDYGARFFNDWYRKDITDWLLRDRNHPCVIIWSLGNETGGNVGKELVEICHQVDPSRLTTSGYSGTQFMDVIGVNGHSEKNDFFKTYTLDRPFVATEAPHTWQVRGFYRTQTWYRDGFSNNGQKPHEIDSLTPMEIFHYDWTAPENKKNRKQVFNSSYDNATVRISARQNWQLSCDMPNFSGHYRWTGFDYLGEASYVHGGWPFRAFMGGTLDMAGFKKDLFYFYQSQWTDEPMVHILPSWTHPQMELGTEIPVWVYSNCDQVELLLNGKSLGKQHPGKQWDRMQCQWLVGWHAGELKAIGYKQGQIVADQTYKTAGTPVKMDIRSETIGKTTIITTDLVDMTGTPYPYGENRIYYHLDGSAEVLSLENGNPVDTETNFNASSRRAFFGKTRAFIKLKDDMSDVNLIIGAICGEICQLSSKSVSIDVQQLNIRGQQPSGDVVVYYTTDSSVPTISSQRYIRPFGVELGTTVKALVVRAGKQVLMMQETFDEGIGLYWSDE